MNRPNLSLNHLQGVACGVLADRISWRTVWLFAALFALMPCASKWGIAQHANPLPRFGPIRVAVLPKSSPHARGDLMRMPPASDLLYPPVAVTADDLKRYPATEPSAPSDWGEPADSPRQKTLAAVASNQGPARTAQQAPPSLFGPADGDGPAGLFDLPPASSGEDTPSGLLPPAEGRPAPRSEGGMTPGTSDADKRWDRRTERMGDDQARDDNEGHDRRGDKDKDESPDFSILSRSADFAPDPHYDCLPYDPYAQHDIYGGKLCYPVQRPWVELGRGFYTPGPIPPSKLFLGSTNPVMPRFLIFGDYRTGIGYAESNGADQTVWAHQLNLDFDFKFTGTERIHAFWSPLDEDGLATRVEADQRNFAIREAFDDDFDTLFFEGDLGYIVSGLDNQFSTFDLPFAFGKFPMLLQNGVWLFDVLEGFSFTLPARHSAKYDVSNYDVTFFFGLDDVDSPAFAGNDNAAHVYGVHGFYETAGGYLEVGYAFLDDRTGAGLGYHNIGISFSKRYWHRVSNAVRVLVNVGQEPVRGEETAEGTLILFENALITSNPNYFVPYLNLFAGIGRPQSVARAAGAGGVLLNTGITFETDNLTGFPTLDATAQNTFGGAIGVNLLGAGFTHQWMVELATVQVFGDRSDRNAAGDQYAIGSRYQMPLNNAWLIRFDTIHGFLSDAPDITGARAELKWKF